MNKSTQVMGRLPRALGDMPAVVRDTELLLLGGGSGADIHDEILAVDPVTGVREVGRLLEPSRGHAAVVIGSNAVATAAGRVSSFGGADTFDAGTMRANALNLVAVFDTESARWKKLPAQIEPREGIVAVKADESVYLVGGIGAPPAMAHDRVDVFRLVTEIISTFCKLHAGRIAPGCGAVGGKLVIAGGVTEGVMNMTDPIEATELD